MLSLIFLFQLALSITPKSSPLPAFLLPWTLPLPSTPLLNSATWADFSHLFKWCSCEATLRTCHCQLPCAVLGQRSHHLGLVSCVTQWVEGEGHRLIGGKKGKQVGLVFPLIWNVYTKVLVCQSYWVACLQPKFVFHFPTNCKSETRVIAWLGSGKGHLLGYRWMTYCCILAL